MNKAFNEFKSNLEIQLLLTKSKNNRFAFCFDHRSNNFELVFDDMDNAIIFLQYFTSIDYFKSINSVVQTSGIVNKEYHFILPIDESDITDVCRILKQYYSYAEGGSSDGVVESYMYNLNTHTIDYIFELIKLMFDESNNILNIENFCNNEI